MGEWKERCLLRFRRKERRKKLWRTSELPINQNGKKATTFSKVHMKKYRLLINKASTS
jgi:hypothetical protein